MSAPHLRDLEDYQRDAAIYHEMCCPYCGNGELAVVARVSVILVDQGTDDDDYGIGTQWDEDSQCDCRNCGWAGKVHTACKAFTTLYAEGEGE